MYGSTILALAATLLAATPAAATPPAATPAAAAPLRNFLYMGQDDLDVSLKLLDRPDIQGVQVLYIWKNLEPQKGVYDFSMIEHDLALAQKRGKQFWLQIQDRSFRPEARWFPKYLLEGPEYGGGIARQYDDRGGTQVAAGWVVRQWDPQVRARYQALIAALAKQFDGRILGFNTEESAADVGKDPPEGYSCDAYFEGSKENILFARGAFKRSHVVQYVNFWPCGWANANGYMSRFFEFAAANRIGVGGPDIVPNWRPQMRNSYPFIHDYRDKVPVVAMAIQEPTLDYINPVTQKPFTKDEFIAFATDYLGVDVIFWARSSPWLAN
ncbi:hypothetical protein OF829_03040 [Sphingomonas sp. LB-2]|uniref:hypothetical protein n=1 Tax=Sphingomonas caeni TaxID=2984949 RepID=UPI0022314713|nr:hypothetical protein [Sphingomonas caeni]MCW3846199.1 hypothetical protein [Sphingomonas caeni]